MPEWLCTCVPPLTQAWEPLATELACARDDSEVEALVCRLLQQEGVDLQVRPVMGTARYSHNSAVMAYIPGPAVSYHQPIACWRVKAT
jgi:hypothetical protein